MTSVNAALERGMATCPAPGEKVLGDHGVWASVNEHALAAAVDRVGHGAQAVAAGSPAADMIEHSAEYGGPRCFDATLATLVPG